ncbi:MAG: SUMF1/EgtB/PvdO family nonheme iron enzyme [Candidatus Hydrogenedentes bacterium]|nr:SUMF1/EgtB/PvdO family nonheme iron enzyme [Candidatus Hydrogenedentota bacterium]
MSDGRSKGRHRASFLLAGLAAIILFVALPSLRAYAGPAGSSAAKAPPLLFVPSGWFEMGATNSEGGDVAEGPRHFVSLSSYWLGKYEVTNGEYAAVLNWALQHGLLKDTSGNPYVGTGDVYAYGHKLILLSSMYCQILNDSGSFSAKSRLGHPMASHPVLLVTWFGAAAYCNWLSEINGLASCYETNGWTCTLEATGYRLPTEAEWERAAAWDTSRTDVLLPDNRTGGHWLYGSASDEIGFSRSNYRSDTEFNDPLDLGASPLTSPVGFFNGANSGLHGATVDSPSRVGAYDLSGNVWEWVNDWYDYYTDANQSNTQGPANGMERVRRGGGWGSLGIDCRTAARGSYDPANGNIAVGFRVCTRSMDEGKPPVADFSLDNAWGRPPLTVSFTDHSMSGSDPIFDWAWNFGDGHTLNGEQPNPEHVYDHEGVYTVTLTVTTLIGSSTRTMYNAVVVSQTLPLGRLALLAMGVMLMASTAGILASCSGLTLQRCILGMVMVRNTCKKRRYGDEGD